MIIAIYRTIVFLVCLAAAVSSNRSLAGSGLTGQDLVPMALASDRIMAGEQTRVNDVRDASLLAGYCMGVSECLPNQTDGTVGQLVDAVKRFLKANPSRLKENAAVLVRDAIEKEWPVRR